MESTQKTALIIPPCSDFNRGDQALVLETAAVIEKTMNIDNIYMMSNNDTKQCEELGLKQFNPILKHPSRLTKKSSNLNYNFMLKLKWGIISIFDILFSLSVKNNVLRKLVKKVAKEETRKSIELYENADVVFVKGGGFMHDYSGGLIGRYTMYYQMYHIDLALKLKKQVYIMPNSYGPFKNKKNIKYVNKILNKCKFASARESISASKETNGLSRNIDLYPDLGFFLTMDESKDIKNKIINQYRIDVENKKYVAITVRPYRFYGSKDPKQKYEEYKKSFTKIVEYLNSLEYNVLLVVHTRAENDHENDEKCIREIYEMIEDKSKCIVIKDDSLNCKQIKLIYSFCDFIIGTRFHSVIFSLEKMIPAIAITYGGHKGDGIMKDMHLSEYAIKIDEISYEILKEKIGLLLKNKDQIRNKIAKYLEWTNKRYEEMIKIIKSEFKQ